MVVDHLVDYSRMVGIVAFHYQSQTALSGNILNERLRDRIHKGIFGLKFIWGKIIVC